MDALQVETESIRVLVVDDHPIFRAGICERLKSVDGQIVVVGEGSDGLQAYELAKKLHPQVILMDIAMPPGITGIEATRKISSDFPDIEIIILSVYDDDQYVNAALQAGASGYLLKTVEEGELRDAVIKVAKGGSALSSSVARRVLTRISGSSTSHGLSERELQVLELAARGATNRNIARELFLSIRTIEAHMRNIFEKLGVSSRTEAVTHAVLHHWIQLSDKDPK